MKSSNLLLVLLFAASSAGAAVNAPVTLVYNPNPNGSWRPGERVLLSMDARRNPEIGQEDVFFRAPFGEVRRVPQGRPGYTYQTVLPGVEPGETIIVQGYMCSAQSGDCYPSDIDNPPSCGVAVPITADGKAACTPTFTWTGGHGDGGVICQAVCL